MDMVTVFILALIIVLAWVLNGIRTRKSQRLPPGPDGLWIFGQAFDKWFDTEYFSNMARKFGEIYTLRILGQNIIVVNSYDAIREAFSSDWLSGRLNTKFQDDFTQGGRGLLLSQGPMWRVHRRFALSVLRNFGFGKSQIELTIQNELQYLRSAFHRQSEQLFSPSQAYSEAASNVINSIVFNERCSEDPNFENIITAVQALGTVQQKSDILVLLWPLLKLLPWDITGLKTIIHSRNKIYEYVGSKYRKHKETFDAANIRDYIDAFLAESGTKEDSQYFTETQLNQCIFDLFFAGMETTTSTISWATIFLAKHPEMQRKVFDEIEQTIGLSQLPQTSDKLKMPYTDAFIHEVQRYATLVPLGLPHRATETGKLCGYDIPEGSLVISDLWNAHRSKQWKDPNNFNPSNFLDDNGNIINTKQMLAFSCGKRACLGESLARQELFIFIVGLVQHFEFVENEQHPLPKLEDCDTRSVFRAPGNFNLIARSRNVN